MRLERADFHRVSGPLAAGGATRGRWRERHGAILVVHAGGERGAGEASPLPGFGEAAPLPGFGEAAPLPGFGADSQALERAVDQLAAFARALPLGVDASRPLASAAALAAGATEPSARFAIETAILSLLARAAGSTVAQLLVDAPADQVAIARIVDDGEGARAAWQAGFRTLKVKLTADDRLAAIAGAAPEARLRVDVNQGWPAAEVDRRLAAIAAVAGPALEYVEEPADLAPSLDGPRAAPLALDESLARPDREQWLDRALAGGAIVTLVLKPTLLGGLSACLALAARARRHGVDAVASHALEGTIAHAAVIQLARALGGARAHGIDVHPGLTAWSAP